MRRRSRSNGCASGYQRPQPEPIPVGGERVEAALKLGVHLAWRAGRISDHDALIGRTLAHVLAGGTLPHATTVDRSAAARSRARSVPQTLRRAEDAGANPVHAQDRQTSAKLVADAHDRARQRRAADLHPRPSGPLGIHAARRGCAVAVSPGRSRFRCATSHRLVRPFIASAASMRTSPRSMRFSTRATIERAAICGISFGGLIALRVAATMPARASALVLASTPGPQFHLKTRHRLYARMPWLFGPLFAAESPSRLRAEVKAALPDETERRGFMRRQLRTFRDAPLSVSRMATRALSDRVVRSGSGLRADRMPDAGRSRRAVARSRRRRQRNGRLRSPHRWRSRRHDRAHRTSRIDHAAAALRRYRQRLSRHRANRKTSTVLREISGPAGAARSAPRRACGRSRRLERRPGSPRERRRDPRRGRLRASASAVRRHDAHQGGVSVSEGAGPDRLRRASIQFSRRRTQRGHVRRRRRRKGGLPRRARLHARAVPGRAALGGGDVVRRRGLA